MSAHLAPGQLPVSRRTLYWSQMLADLRADRAPRPEIREERLALQGSAIRLSCWRGRSGRRHVVRVHGLGSDALTHAQAGLAIAVSRDAGGLAAVVDVAPEGARMSWFSRALAMGATELHVYCLADDAAGRAAVAMDLMPA